MKTSEGVRAVVWVAVALLVLVFVNALAYVAFAMTHQGPSLVSELWMYLQSASAQLVTAGIGIPVLLLLLERLFKVRERAEERQVEEKRERAGVERELRAKAIDDTVALWLHLLEVGYQIAYFPETEIPREVLRDSRQQVRGMTATVTPVISGWRYRFPNLDDATLGALKKSVGLFLNALDGVLYWLENEADPATRDELRAHLRTILLWSLRPMHSFVEVASLSVVTLERDDVEPGRDRGADDPLAKAMKSHLEILDSRLNQVAAAPQPEASLAHRLLPLLADREAAELDEQFEAWKAWRQEHRRPSTEWPGFAELERIVSQLPYDRVHEALPMTVAQIKAMADRCDLLLLAEKLA